MWISGPLPGEHTYDAGFWPSPISGSLRLFVELDVEVGEERFQLVRLKRSDHRRHGPDKMLEKDCPTRAERGPQFVDERGI